jgi:hypothetical protein
MAIDSQADVAEARPVSNRRMTRPCGRPVSAAWLLAAVWVLGAAPAKAADLAPADSKATLSVEYVYESKGATKTPGDAKRWDRRRVTRVAADMVSLPPGPLPSLHTTSAAQSADVERRTKAGEKLAIDATPGVALGLDAMEQAMKKCGDDEDCVAKAMMKSGALSDPRMKQAGAAAQAAGRELKPMAPRYQVWASKAMSGSYEIAETEHHEFMDQQCPNVQCTADTVTSGKGVPPSPKTSGMPAITTASVEMDITGATMVLALPMPFAALPVTRVVTSNLVAGKPHSPAGTFADDRPMADGLNPERLQITVPLKGSWRNQSGEAVISSQGGGKLIARWQLVAK